MNKKRFDTEELGLRTEELQQNNTPSAAPKRKEKRIFESNENFPISKTLRISKEQAKFLFDETIKASQAAGRVVNEAEIIRSIIEDAMKTGD